MSSYVDSRPSFFEVYASQHLSSAMRPAVRFVLEVLSVRNPRLIRIATWSDEIFTAVLLVLETSHLRRQSALLAESFYSLRRSQIDVVDGEVSGEQLPPYRVLVSLFFAVLVPHVRVKLDEWYSSATGGAAAALYPEEFPFAPRPRLTEGQPEENDQEALPNAQCRSERLRRLIAQLPSLLRRLFKALRRRVQNPAMHLRVLTVYSRICAAFDAINLVIGISYLYGHSEYFTLPLALQRLVLRRASPEEYLRLTPSAVSPVAGSERASLSPASSLLSTASETALTLLKASFFASIFAFRFLQYYYAAEASAPRESGPIIPPPEELEPASGVDKRTAMAPGICPLCHNVRSNPTACSTSGYVFCYLCIVSHLQQTPKCPVTLAPTTVHDLVRVYDDATAT